MQYVYSTYYVYVYVVFTKDILRLPTSIPGKSFFYKHPCNSLEWWWRILWRMLYLQETLTFQILNIYFEFHKNTKTEIWGTKNFEKRIRFSSKKNSWLYFTVSKNLKIEKNWEELRKSEKRKTRKECFVWRKFGWKIRPFVMLVVERHNSNFKIMSEREEHCYIMGRRNTKNLSTRKITTVVLS